MEHKGYPTRRELLINLKSNTLRISLFLCLIVSLSLKARDTLFSRAYGSITGDDRAWDMVVISDNHYLVVLEKQLDNWVQWPERPIEEKIDDICILGIRV